MDRKFILVPPNIQIFLSIKIMLEKRDILREQRKLKTKGVIFLINQNLQITGARDFYGVVNKIDFSFKII